MISLYSTDAPLRAPEPEEDVDPMSSVANIADAMLVFACGLLVALVVAWDVDLSAVKEVEIENSEEVTDLESMKDMLAGEGSSYVQRGTVYQDPKTGTMYLIEDEGTGDEQGEAEGGANASSGSNAQEGAGGD